MVFVKVEKRKFLMCSLGSFSGFAPSFSLVPNKRGSAIALSTIYFISITISHKPTNYFKINHSNYSALKHICFLGNQLFKLPLIVSIFNINFKYISNIFQLNIYFILN